jgi:hypothetical protein
LHNQNSDNEEESTEKQTNDNINITQQTASNNKQQIAQITSTIFNIFSYTIQFLGAVFTFGLVLNLLGYGYRFDFENGLEINKLENIRNEIQFEREIIREEREDYLKERGQNYKGDGREFKDEIVIGNWGKSILMK